VKAAAQHSASIPFVGDGEATHRTAVSISVVVCTRDRPEALERCLTGLSDCEPSFETIVVDNAPASRPVADIAAKYGARYVLESVIGLSRARNAGLRSATGDVVAFVDDDAVPHGAWVSCLSELFRDPDVGAVGGEIVPSTADPDPGAYRIVNRRRVKRADSYWFEIASFGGVGNGGNMSFRRKALLQVGGFDERLGLGSTVPGFEDHDAFMRVVEAGYTAVSDPDVIVSHDARGRDSRQRVTAQYASALPYLVFLFMERPAYRHRIVRYALEAFTGKRREWRVQNEMPALTRRQRFIAALSTPRLAWRALAQSRRSTNSATLLR
jgi:cellulose synthase/poly-beta-1,6-N-acetylglucosamine synthase-like glycosyltransferase